MSDPPPPPDAPADPLARFGRLGRWLRRWADMLGRRPFVAAWQAVALTTFTVTIVGGVLVRVTDPQSIASVWDGMWWAVQTVTTVGYGDTIPESHMGRLIATAVMMLGIAFLTVTTAAIGSLFNESARHKRQLRHEDPVQEEVERLHARLDELMAELREIRVALADGAPAASGESPGAGGEAPAGHPDTAAHDG